MAKRKKTNKDITFKDVVNSRKAAKKSKEKTEQTIEERRQAYHLEPRIIDGKEVMVKVYDPFIPEDANVNYIHFGHKHRNEDE